MKIYTLQLSEDGLMNKAATNAKVLMHLVELSNYSVNTIAVFDKGNSEHLEIPYNYSNILKAIKLSTFGGKYYASFRLEGVGCSIYISEIQIVSK
jgi:hypothetical protein